MRSLLAVVFAALVGAAGLSAAQTTTWSWQGLDTNSATNSAGASIGFSRQGSGPLHLEAASAVVACPQSRARQEFNLSLRNAGITVNTDGTFTYDGPAEEIEIDIQGNTLSIAGCRKDRSCASGISYQQMEITYSNFEKTLRFPSPIEGATIEHMFENGLLIITLRKA